MTTAVERLLDRACSAYYKGEPLMTDAQFDSLADKYNYQKIGSTVLEPWSPTVTHVFKMYSLSKVYDDEEYNIYYPEDHWVKTPKLDGAAVEVTYIDGHLAVAATRGDGVKGQDITEKMLLLVPDLIPVEGNTQIVGEVVVVDKNIENSRNYASGALNLKDIEEFKTRIPNLVFIAYNYQNTKETDRVTYIDSMDWIFSFGFNVATKVLKGHTYPTDGEVFRLDSNEEFYKLGFTSKFPRGAYARKQSNAVEIEETELLEVIWQVGPSGKVTPVAIFEEVVIDDAKITRASLHNPGFIEDMDLDVGDTILVTRAGGVIPRILGKV